jgi:phage FluMu gp28-like protein
VIRRPDPTALQAAPPAPPAAPVRNPLTDEVAGAWPAADANQPPPVLMGYQQRWVADPAQLKVAEKSRRVGLTWAEAADDVLIAAAERGSNVFYISATQDMAREYVEACAVFARAYNLAAGSIGEGLYDDGDDAAGNRKYIKTYEIVFPKSGRRIVALSSRPTNLRGKQGVVVIDEAAFAGDLAGLLKAAMAMLLWGDKVRIISTHNGRENAFNALVDEVRAGKRGTPAEASVHRITFREAVADGLFRRVCLRRGKPWTAAAEQAWVDAAYRFYAEHAAEELDAIPSASAGTYLSLALIHERMVPAWVPESGNSGSGPVVIRQLWDDGFAYLPEDVRAAAIEAWCREQLEPHMRRLHPGRRHVFAQDFARNRDQSVIVVLEEDADLTHRPVLTVELANCPFSSQEQIAKWLVRRLPRFRGGAMDATGNGAALAEAMAQTFGVEMIEQVKLSDAFYLAHMPKLKAALQDGTLRDLARDDQHEQDLRAIKLVQGVPKVPRQATQSAGQAAAAAEGGQRQQRHGDYAIALFLAEYAFHREAGEIAWTPAPGKGDRGAEALGSGGAGRFSKRPNHGSDWAAAADSGRKAGW